MLIPFVAPSRSTSTADRWTLAERIVVVMLSIAAVAHQARWWEWCIEDAAISYAYARNFANGDGFVPFVGGERVEGFSNPTWVFLLMPFHRLGLDLFSVSRGLEAVLCALTVPLAWLIGREVDDRPRSIVPLASAALLAANPQFAHWGQSGLENGLYSFLVAGGLFRLLVEVRVGGTPWSALWFLLVGWTRPEAPVVVALAWSLRCAWTWERDGWRGTAWWTTLVLGPSLAFEALRLWYFAWPFPQTFYAKLEEKDKGWWVWEHKGGGWMYVRNWAHSLGIGYLLPVGVLGAWGYRQAAPMAFGVAVIGLPVAARGPTWLLFPVSLFVLWGVVVLAVGGAGRRSRWALFGLVAGIGVTAAMYQAHLRGWAAPKLPLPKEFENVPVYAMLSAFLFVPGRSWLMGNRARTAVTVFTAFGLVWCVVAVGDWMKGFRWLSLCAVPLSVVLASGVSEAARLVQVLWNGREDRLGLAGAVAAVALFLAPMPAAWRSSEDMATKPDTTPFSVKARVDFVQSVRKRIHHEGNWVDYDVDMGAHMWWSDFEMVDMAGLVDTPMAQHRFQRQFLSEYLFKERRPHFMHVHGNWASTSKIPTLPEFKSDYVEIPGYAQGKSIHPGNYLRRDSLLSPTWPHPEQRRVRFADGITLEGWDIPSPEVGKGRMFYVEVGMSTRPRKEGQDFRLLLFLHDESGVAASWDVPLGYDWLLPNKWGLRDKFIGRYDLPLPVNVEEGRYGVGFVVVAADGSVVEASPLPDPADADSDPERLSAGAVVGGRDETEAKFARGELRFDAGLTVVSIDALSGFAKTDREAALKAAADGKCEAAEVDWALARHHRPQNDEWVAEHQSRVSSAFATCFAGLAAAEPAKAVVWLERALHWDSRNADYLAAAGPFAEALYEQGEVARLAGDFDTAYARYDAALSVWPWHAWARRRAEEARTARLDLDPAVRAAERHAEQTKREEQRKKRGSTASGAGSLPASSVQIEVEEVPDAPAAGGDEAL